MSALGGPSKLVSRASRSPRTPAALAASTNTPNGTPIRYESFPTAAQMAADRSSSSGSGIGSASKPAPSVPASFSVVPARTASMADDFDPAAKAKLQAIDRRGLNYAWIIFLVSAPAILGMCCWPSLVAALSGGSVSASTRTLAHTVSFTVTAVLLLAMLAFFVHDTRTRRLQQHTTRVAIYGPLVLLVFASVLVMCEPLRHLLQNHNVWTGPSVVAFRDGCGEGWKCLTTTGWLFLGLLTWWGFLTMFIAAAWQGNLLNKFRLCASEWHRVRAAWAAEELASANNVAREESERVREESQRVRHAAILAASARSPPSFSSMHMQMAPPVFMFRSEESNKAARVGHLTGQGFERHGNGGDGTTVAAASSNNKGAPRNVQVPVVMPSTSPMSTTLAMSRSSGTSSLSPSATPADYSGEGYSFEVHTPAVGESVIKVGGGAGRQQPPRSTSSAGGVRGREVALSLGTASPTVMSPSTSSIGGGGRGGISSHNHHYLSAHHAGLSHLSYPSPISSMGPTSHSFADVALTPAAGYIGDVMKSPPAARGTRTPHVHGPLDSPPSSTALSPHTGPLVREQFTHLQEASSPFNKQKWVEQQREEELARQPARGQV